MAGHWSYPLHQLGRETVLDGAIPEAGCSSGGCLSDIRLRTRTISSYIAGLILLAAAPCTAMVFVWSNLSDGEPHFTLSQVALNDVIMVFAFAPIVGSAPRPVCDYRALGDVAALGDPVHRGASHHCADHSAQCLSNRRSCSAHAPFIHASAGFAFGAARHASAFVWLPGRTNPAQPLIYRHAGGADPGSKSISIQVSLIF